MKRKMLLSLLALAASVAVAIPALAAKLTDADVGDADSFGKKVVWIGVVSTGSVILSEDCSSPDIPPLGPNDRCVALLAAPASTSFAFPDLGRITLPGKSTETLICHWATPLLTYSFANPTGTSIPAQITIRSTFRLESAVLNDPALINPFTGLPFNGGIDIGGLPTYRDSQTIALNEVRSQTIQATRSCIEGLMSTSTLVSSYGLTENQAKSFFGNPITIRAGVSGSARLVSGGQVIVGTRFTGDQK
ncbi:MAG: hypothetical protein U1F15_02645 [Burkholderiales bacterium]